MKTLQSGYKQIINPDGSISFIWLGTGRGELFSNGLISMEKPELSSLPRERQLLLEKQAKPFSLGEFIEKYWVYMAIGLLAIMVLRK